MIDGIILPDNKPEHIEGGPHKLEKPKIALL